MRLRSLLDRCSVIVGRFRVGLGFASLLSLVGRLGIAINGFAIVLKVVIRIVTGGLLGLFGEAARQEDSRVIPGKFIVSLSLNATLLPVFGDPSIRGVLRRWWSQCMDRFTEVRVDEGARRAEGGGLPIEQGDTVVILGAEDIDCMTYGCASVDSYHDRRRLWGG